MVSGREKRKFSGGNLLTKPNIWEWDDVCCSGPPVLSSSRKCINQIHPDQCKEILPLSLVCCRISHIKTSWFNHRTRNSFYLFFFISLGVWWGILVLSSIRPGWSRIEWLIFLVVWKLFVLKAHAWIWSNSLISVGVVSLYLLAIRSIGSYLVRECLVTREARSLFSWFKHLFTSHLLASYS